MVLRNPLCFESIVTNIFAVTQQSRSRQKKALYSDPMAFLEIAFLGMAASPTKQSLTVAGFFTRGKSTHMPNPRNLAWAVAAA
jgi:hypothetical protein